MADVICRNCHGRYHETTEQFDPEASPHGGMFRLKEPYKGNAWSSFPEHEGVRGDNVECPGCLSPYADINGRVKLDLPEVAANVEPIVPADTAWFEKTVAEAMDVTDDKKILALSRSGKTAGEIGKLLGIHHKTVSARLKAMGEV